MKFKFAAQMSNLNYAHKLKIIFDENFPKKDARDAKINLKKVQIVSFYE